MPDDVEIFFDPCLETRVRTFPAWQRPAATVVEDRIDLLRLAGECRAFIAGECALVAVCEELLEGAGLSGT
jgi:hypothetical protein